MPWHAQHCLPVIAYKPTSRRGITCEKWTCASTRIAKTDVLRVKKSNGKNQSTYSNADRNSNSSSHCMSSRSSSSSSSSSRSSSSSSSSSRSSSSSSSGQTLWLAYSTRKPSGRKNPTVPQKQHYRKNRKPLIFKRMQARFSKRLDVENKRKKERKHEKDPKRQKNKTTQSLQAESRMSDKNDWYITDVGKALASFSTEATNSFLTTANMAKVSEQIGYFFTCDYKFPTV